MPAPPCAPALPQAHFLGFQAAAGLHELQWHVQLVAKLRALLASLTQHSNLVHTLSLVQAWFPTANFTTPTQAQEVYLYAEPSIALITDAALQSFRAASTAQPFLFRSCMAGRVWRSGAVQIVQNLKIIPNTVHPRSSLADEQLDTLCEVVYLPVYDACRAFHQAPVAVLEALFSVRAEDGMAVADFISFAGRVLGQLQLSLSSPVQAPLPAKAPAFVNRRRKRAELESADDIQQPHQQKPHQPDHAGEWCSSSSREELAATATATTGTAGSTAANNGQQPSAPTSTAAMADAAVVVGTAALAAAAAAAAPPPQAPAPATSSPTHGSGMPARRSTSLQRTKSMRFMHPSDASE